jgi:membrane protein implicated in regulation of membrane protease activity
VLLRKIRQFESSGNLDYDNAIGKTGVVYLSIPANEQTGGQIQIHFQGRLITTDARTDGKAIPTGQKVIVYDRRENILWVQPVEDIDI